MKFTKTSFALFAAALLVTMGCPTEIDDQPAAEVVEGSTTASRVEEVDRRVGVDTERSTIRFVGAKVTRQHDGEFHDFDGWVGFAGDEPRQIEFTIDTASLETDEKKLDGHLRSADFFEVEKFPEAKFVSSSIDPVDSPAAEGPSHNITGTLDLHGIQKEIRFPVNVGMTADGLRAIAQFTINRKDWSINYPGAADDLIRDDVLIKLDLLFPETEEGEPPVSTTASGPAA